MFNITKKLFGSFSARKLSEFQKIVNKINNFEPSMINLSDSELAAKTTYFKEQLSKDKTLDQILPEAFAVVREASKRTVNLRHYDVQLIGGIVLHNGMITEMKTGEGKTLVATLAAYLNTLDNDTVHIITVNDYLAQRDSLWMGSIYKFLGLSVGCITSNTSPDKRLAEYQSDIVYATNNEIGFDFLRDNLKSSFSEICIKKQKYAIVDEVDSVLIDEARTPLVISAASNESIDLYPKIDSLVKFLKNEDYEKDEEKKSIILTESGMVTIESLLINNGIIKEGTLQDLDNLTINHHITQSLRAHHLFRKDKDYVVQNNQVMIVDELSGRLMEGRRYGDGLHQAIEAKEKLNIQQENQTVASVTFQNFFRSYSKLCGMTGTALTEAEEFENIYKLSVLDLPTNIKNNRIDQEDQIYRTKKEKYLAIVNLIKERNKKNQPILIGTTSVENSEIISNELKKENISHNVLNAKFHHKEAEIIAKAGIPGSVTISTNMAGRGTDIQLGGNNQIVDIKDFEKKEVNFNYSEENRKIAIDAGGLLVIGTERHESRRVDNQLRGRSGRQGDIGETIFFLSLEDDLMRIFGSNKLEGVLGKLGIKENEVITHSLITKALERAQKKVEAHNFDIRKQLLRFDDILNDQRKIIYNNRKEILENEDHSATIQEMKEELINDLILESIPPKSYINDWDHEKLSMKCSEVFGLNLPIKAWMNEEGVDEEEIKKRIIDQTDQKYAEKINKYSSDIIRFTEKRVMLYQIDKDWKDHLAAMDSLRSSVNLRAMGGKDPFMEYRRESFNFFDEMLSNQNEKVVKTVYNLEIVSSSSKKNEEDKKVKSYYFGKKIPRNSICPCGSGKKYKHCHGK